MSRVGYLLSSETLSPWMATTMRSRPRKCAGSPSSSPRASAETNNSTTLSASKSKAARSTSSRRSTKPRRSRLRRSCSSTCIGWRRADGLRAWSRPTLVFKKRQAYPESQDALAEYAGGKMWPELVPRAAQDFNGQPVDELENRVAELAAVARHFDGTLSIHSGSGKQARVLSMIGHATRGRVNYKISGELQLQLLDVLSQQPAGSPWRSLFERMVDRCCEFAARNAFGAESALAARYQQTRPRLLLGGRRAGPRRRQPIPRFLDRQLGRDARQPLSRRRPSFLQRKDRRATQ